MPPPTTRTGNSETRIFINTPRPPGASTEANDQINSMLTISVLSIFKNTPLGFVRINGHISDVHSGDAMIPGSARPTSAAAKHPGQRGRNAARHEEILTRRTGKLPRLSHPPPSADRCGGVHGRNLRMGRDPGAIRGPVRRAAQAPCGSAHACTPDRF
ncbi:hypothetical protein SDC9_159760 [bioreactor metagenome]|uniref:Uncharacterized protein n=1 Tax=bioreactor metagenome TaxID=1076179 RepID=A0A645FG26_9ZZZZ